jgi:hypothetical protein
MSVWLGNVRRQTAMRCYGKAATMCEAKAQHPLVRPKSIDAKRAQKANWSDPAMRDKLAVAYAVAEGDDEKAARPRRESWLGPACEEAVFACRSN